MRKRGSYWLTRTLQASETTDRALRIPTYAEIADVAADEEQNCVAAFAVFHGTQTGPESSDSTGRL